MFRRRKIRVGFGLIYIMNKQHEKLLYATTTTEIYKDNKMCS